MSALLKACLPLLIALYPLAVYLGLQQGAAAFLPWLLVVVGVVHLLRALLGTRSAWLWVVVCGLLAGWSWVDQSALGVKLYPVAINLSLAILFAATLFSPPSMIERLARLQEPNLPDAAIPYTRRVTQVWVLFFVVSGSISTATVWASDEVWALYNGLIAYLLIGLMFGGEWLIRQRVKRGHSE